jgi:hypothetical protein
MEFLAENSSGMHFDMSLLDRDQCLILDKINVLTPGKAVLEVLKIYLMLNLKRI